jgi:predicted phage baseplate assembly protein
MLLQHNLDDERFAEIAERARLKAPEYFPPWTDLNTHDPGVTLIELFAWLTEQQRFHLDQSEAAAPFFPLLGIAPRRATAATAEITLAGGLPPRLIPAGTPLFAEDVRFETEEDANYKGDPLTVRVIQRETMNTPFLLGYANGFPNSRFTADPKGRTVLHDGFALEVNGEAWTPADDFRLSDSEDRHYVLDDETGEITFGDGIHGLMPKGEVLITAMAVTRGAGGNIAPMRLTELAGLPVSQPEAAEGGAARETIFEALTRARENRRRAVTAKDIEQIVLETPGLDLERVRAFTARKRPGLGEPREISIAVKLKAGVADADAESQILSRLEPYRLVCREFRVISPEYVRIGLSLEIRAKPRAENFKEELENSLRKFFAERYGGFGTGIRVAEIRAFAAAAPDVLEAPRCTLRAYGGAKTDAAGDIFLSPGALAELGDVDLRITDALY